jgi:hypothetical protein
MYQAAGRAGLGYSQWDKGRRVQSHRSMPIRSVKNRFFQFARPSLVTPCILVFVMAIVVVVLVVMVLVTPCILVFVMAIVVVVLVVMMLVTPCILVFVMAIVVVVLVVMMLVAVLVVVVVVSVAVAALALEVVATFASHELTKRCCSHG